MKEDMPPRRTALYKYIKAFLIAELIIFILITACCYVAGNKLTAPVHRAAGAPPRSLDAEEIRFAGSGGKNIKGWLIQSPESQGVVIPMHGLREDRRAMVSRAEFLHQNGYNVLLFDFQAHGESDGEYITFGYNESEDARAAVHFAREKYPSQPVAVIGRSLGGAACLIGDTPIDAEALILESVYPTIEEAIANRLEIYTGKAGRYLAPLFTVQLQWRFGIPPKKLRPIEGIRKIRCPVLIAGGDADRRTTLPETENLYNAAPAPKELWIIQNAGHVDFCSLEKDEYEEHILGFLGRYLKIDTRYIAQLYMDS